MLILEKIPKLLTVPLGTVYSFQVHIFNNKKFSYQ
jgi:hypothetical protein